MTCPEELTALLRARADREDAGDYCLAELLRRAADALENPEKREEAIAPEVEINVFDLEEIYTNCTVQVLTNSRTGQVSVGWWKNDPKQKRT